jgi:uncharacterized transporter YbjL
LTLVSALALPANVMRQAIASAILALVVCIIGPYVLLLNYNAQAGSQKGQMTNLK